jgi:hypothetical protein
MEKFFFLENNIDLVNKIISTTGQVIPVVEEQETISPAIFDTFKKILDFLNKILEILPDIKISSAGEELNIKSTITEKLNELTEIWIAFPNRNVDILDAWMYFDFWWSEYYKKAKILKNSDSSIFLSMN